MKKPPTTLKGAPQELEYLVRQRASKLYQGRGREDGRGFDDWLRAEDEIARQKVHTAVAS
jgi:DUF2934 family protein